MDKIICKNCGSDDFQIKQKGMFINCTAYCKKCEKYIKNISYKEVEKYHMDKIVQPPGKQLSLF